MEYNKKSGSVSLQYETVNDWHSCDNHPDNIVLVEWEIGGHSFYSKSYYNNGWKQVIPFLQGYNLKPLRWMEMPDGIIV